jgi:heat shock protein HtpX
VSSNNPIQAQIATNRRRALLLLGSFIGLFVLFGLVIGLIAGVPVIGLGLALLAGLGAAAWVYRSADGLALSRSGAAPAGADEYPRYHNVVEGLCVAAGIPKPGLYVVRADALNACAVGRDPAHAALVVTTGLLERLSRIELEGILAQQLSHIRTHDIFPATVAVPLVGVLPPLLPLAVGTDREALADQTGVRLTRYPPGLINALEKIRTGPSTNMPVPKAVAHLWLVPAGDRVGTPLAKRIAALKEL